MSDITIVTAFFDIGRGGWTREKGHPFYLERSVDTYIERYSHLAKLHNELIVITTQDIIDKIKVHRSLMPDNTKYIVFDLNLFAHLRAQIEKIQLNPSYQAFIFADKLKNPEYWNPDYVLVTNLKAFFVNFAVKQGLVTNDMAAWIDFGYCRNASKIPASKKWEYDFNPEKIHLFSCKDYKAGRPISAIVASNDVHIFGAKVVAHKKLWADMERLMWASFTSLYKQNLVDDDQTLWLMSYLKEPELFELHKIPDNQERHDPFVLFNCFNSTIQTR